MLDFYKFQWAPTLGGECYIGRKSGAASSIKRLFQWAPTLGGECYATPKLNPRAAKMKVSMDTHPWG